MWILWMAAFASILVFGPTKIGTMIPRPAASAGPRSEVSSHGWTATVLAAGTSLAAPRAAPCGEALIASRTLLDNLSKPSGVSDEVRMQRVAAVIQRAVNNGQTEVFVGKFPNTLCTDHGRAIN